MLLKKIVNAVKPVLFKIVVVFAFVSLAGIIFTQVYWVRNAWTLKEEQFDSRVKVALKTVVNRLYKRMPAPAKQVFVAGCPATCAAPDSDTSGLVIDGHLLDSLLNDEFECMDVDRGFFYAVFSTKGDKPLMGNPGQYYKEIVQSPHAVSLSCLHEDNVFYLGVYFPGKRNFIVAQLIGWMFLSVFFTAIIIFSFAWTVLAFIRQRKLTEMKSDFVNNMTHELRTPVSAISLASEMLLKPMILADREKIEKYASLIFDQNNRMKSLVEHVLQVSAFDRHEYRLNLSLFSVHEVIDDLVASFSLIVEGRGGTIQVRAQANQHEIKADRLYLTNILSSLIDNAEKYSPGRPFIDIHTRSDIHGVYTMVTDKGIGMTSGQRRNVFQRFYRVHTGNVHNVKGYGLGLYNAQVLAKAHGGTLSVSSEPGQGSTFTLFLPFAASVSPE